MTGFEIFLGVIIAVLLLLKGIKFHQNILDCDSIDMFSTGIMIVSLLIWLGTRFG